MIIFGCKKQDHKVHDAKRTVTMSIFYYMLYNIENIVVF